MLILLQEEIPESKTIQIDFLEINAPLVEPSLSQQFTHDFQDLFLRQTNLTWYNLNGDLRLKEKLQATELHP